MGLVGILMPVASLPSEFGIGDFGIGSYQFIDLLVEAGIGIWQILPLNPLGYGNSPYQPYSSYAGDELYISIELLLQDGLLTQEDMESKQVKHYRKRARKRTMIDYEEARRMKRKLLKKAFRRFVPQENYQEFRKQEWVYIYAVFVAFKHQNNSVCWNEWPKEQRDWIKDRRYNIDHLREQIEFEIFLQFLFLRQWKKLKVYANMRNIKIMGDLPFYVGMDSQDVWQHQEDFLLDSDGKPLFIAGVPPDYFSKTGQRWGNPIYNWKKIQEGGYTFWLQRLQYCHDIFDITRIDHFRAFDTYWKIPISCPTAVEGEWVEAPGYEFFKVLFQKIPDINIVVEDLGDLRVEVEELRDAFCFKGMKVLQFTFDSKEQNNNFEDKENLIIYTGTHDNQTIRGWYRSQSRKEKRRIKSQLRKKGYRHGAISWRFVQMALDSVAEIAIIPYQDLTNMGDKGRINRPGTVGTPNWQWRVISFKSFQRKIRRLKARIELQR